ncbi:MAG: DUF4445 domain-containing protein [Desulfamplus sp.]|nr:DUF4445 domain-containing protein [Desulfamplus sp.]
MTTIFVKPVQITIEMNSGDTVHQSLERVGIKIETPCGGNGICGGCRIWAEEPYRIASTPHENITLEEETKGLRLACMAIPNADTSIRLEENYVYDNKEHSHNRANNKKSHMRILSSGMNLNTDSDRTMKNSVISSSISLPVDRVVSSPKGLAIDIGTTTLVISLVSLTTGEILASCSSLNPQVVHGHDVLSRIQYASTSKGLAKMTSLINNKINELVEQACQESGSKKDEIIDVTIGANTTMLQIAAAIDPTPLGHLPFKVDISSATTFAASQFGLDVNSSARVYLPPVMHAFVGSDISAGLLRCPEFFEDDKSVLYLDMGTNGEICLNVKGRRFTTSTAAGPAFEGMGISSGMRATDGAVEQVEIDAKNSSLIFHVIGDDEIKGVCGSGIVDFIAALLTTGSLDQSGKFKFIEDKFIEDEQSQHIKSECLQLIEDEQFRLVEDGEFRLAQGEHTLLVEQAKSQLVKKEQVKVVKINSQLAFRYGEDIYLTQKDIRQIQLAKGAVRTGVDLILKRGAITCEELDKIYIAGGFGNFLNPVNMEKIGLLPEHSSDKVVFCGNACIDGSIMLLVNKNSRTFLEGALHDMEHLQLADSPEFMNCFVKNLSFISQSKN